MVLNIINNNLKLVLENYLNIAYELFIYKLFYIFVFKTTLFKLRFLLYFFNNDIYMNKTCLNCFTPFFWRLRQVARYTMYAHVSLIYNKKKQRRYLSSSSFKKQGVKTLTGQGVSNDLQLLSCKMAKRRYFFSKNKM